jgi:hypothetical protein
MRAHALIIHASKSPRHGWGATLKSIKYSKINRTFKKAIKMIAIPGNRGDR